MRWFMFRSTGVHNQDASKNSQQYCNLSTTDSSTHFLNYYGVRPISHKVKSATGSLVSSETVVCSGCMLARVPFRVFRPYTKRSIFRLARPKKCSILTAPSYQPQHTRGAGVAVATDHHRSQPERKGVGAGALLRQPVQQDVETAFGGGNRACGLHGLG